MRRPLQGRTWPALHIARWCEEEERLTQRGARVGVLLFFGMLGLAGWNEYRNVATLRTLAEGRDSVQALTQCTDINEEFHGKLVHVTCALYNPARPISAALLVNPHPRLKCTHPCAR